MSLFIPTIPTSGQNLDFSQGQLLSNNQGLDTVFGIDHYKFSDATANKGFHNQVTTPPRTSGIPAMGPNPIFFGFQPTSNIGVLQYSLSTKSAIPSPLTRFQSGATPTVIAPSSAIPILDLSGVTRGMFIVTAMDSVISNNQIAYVTWSSSGSLMIINNLVALSNTKLFITQSGSVIQINNASPSISSNNVYWTIEFLELLPIIRLSEAFYV